MRRLRRPAIVGGVVGLVATVVVLSGAGAQEVPQLQPCETVADATTSTLPPEVPVSPPTVPPTVPSAVPSTLPTVPVETPTPAALPENVPQPPCQPTTTTTLPPLDEEYGEEYWDEFVGGPVYPGSFGIVTFDEPVDPGNGALAVEVPIAPAPAADTTDIQPIASGEGGFRYAQVFVLPLLMLLAAAAVAWTLTQPVTAPARR